MNLNDFIQIITICFFNLKEDIFLYVSWMIQIPFFLTNMKMDILISISIRILTFTRMSFYEEIQRFRLND